MNRHHVVRALLAPAAVAAGLALAACNPTDIPTTGRALAPLSDRVLADMKSKHMDKNAPILVRIFKEEAELEVWKKNQEGEFALLKTYPICRWSGDLGPKIKEGDRQAPEGFYTITRAQMNPNSNYYLAFNTGYPNAYDRAWGHTGSELMVHGDCSSRGCYAMTDEQIQEIYALARDAFFGGQKEFQFEAFPFRMTALNMAKHRNNPNFAFWKMLKEGYDDFEATHQEPKVAVCEKRYVFDAAPPENSTTPLNFTPTGKCPVYRLDPAVAEAVLDHRRSEQIKMAEYIAKDVATTPPHFGDGGMNPVFASKVTVQEAFDNKGRLVEIAKAPGALPRTPNASAPASTVVMPQQPPTKQPVLAASQPAVAPSQPVVTASDSVAMATVPMPTPAPLPKEGKAPTEPPAVAKLFGNLFHGSEAQANPAPETESQTLALRGTTTETSAKPNPPAVRTVSAPVRLHPKLRHEPAPKALAAHTAKPEPKKAAVAAAKPVPKKQPTVAAAKSEPKQSPTVAANKPAAPADELRAAFAGPKPATNAALLPGAQPALPAGSFASRWAGLR